MGDIRSMVGGTNVGARRLLELIDKYGLEQLEDLVRELSGLYRAAYSQRDRQNSRGHLPRFLRDRGRRHRSRQDLYRARRGYGQRLRLSLRFHRHGPAGARRNQCRFFAVDFRRDVRLAMLPGAVDSDERGLLPPADLYAAARHHGQSAASGRLQRADGDGASGDRRGLPGALPGLCETRPSPPRATSMCTP